MSVFSYPYTRIGGGGGETNSTTTTRTATKYKHNFYLHLNKKGQLVFFFLTLCYIKICIQRNTGEGNYNSGFSFIK